MTSQCLNPFDCSIVLSSEVSNAIAAELTTKNRVSTFFWEFKTNSSPEFTYMNVTFFTLQGNHDFLHSKKGIEIDFQFARC